MTDHSLSLEYIRELIRSPEMREECEAEGVALMAKIVNGQVRYFVIALADVQKLEADGGWRVPVIETPEGADE